MKALCFLPLLFPLLAQGSSLLINEVGPSNHHTRQNEQGESPDWIELYNPGSKVVDLQGLRIALDGHTHIFARSVLVPAKGHVLLLCTGRRSPEATHVPFPLPRRGGTLLLIDRNGSSILDMFTWPAMGKDISIGRSPDGSTSWSYFEKPSPGSPNPSGMAVRSITPSPTADHASGSMSAPFDLQLQAPAGSTIRYTLDGGAPDGPGAMEYTGPIRIERHAVIRAKAWSMDALPSSDFMGSYTVGHADRPFISLACDPQDLFGDQGIYHPGSASNHTRSGRAWERPAAVQFVAPEGFSGNVGLRLSGSGSRSLGKRSFKLYARKLYDGELHKLPFPDGTSFSTGLLRADASPHAFLRNLLMENLVREHQLDLAVQPSTPLPLYLNGQYWGLYRWMPPKDDAWLKHLSGTDAVDVLAGPATEVIAGDEELFRLAQERLEKGAPIDSIAELIDLASLIDLACVDLWTGRGDHDLNVRCYRPREPGGRWRWVLFDMDLWAPANENTVERMCSATAPETPFVPQLLAHPELQELLLARITAIQATVFAPATVQHMADQLFATYREELLADHRRWELELDPPDPVRSLTELRAFAEQRPKYLMQHLAERSGRKLRTVVIDVPDASMGSLLLEGLALPPGRHRIVTFSGIPLQLEAKPAVQHDLSGWKGLDAAGTQVTLNTDRTRHVRATFSAVAP